MKLYRLGQSRQESTSLDMRDYRRTRITETRTILYLPEDLQERVESLLEDPKVLRIFEKYRID